MTKVRPLYDESGYKLPKNMSQQFRDVQGGIEHLKDAADDIKQNLKKANKKLDSHTTDLSVITERINQIDNNLKVHMQNTEKSLNYIGNVLNRVIGILEKHSHKIYKK